MNHFEELDDFLLTVGWNYWGDAGIEDACELLEKISDSDWIELEKIAMHRPIEWQTRLVEILDTVQNEVSTRILFEMFKIDNEWLTQSIVLHLSNFSDAQLKTMKGIDIDFSKISERIRLGVSDLKLRNKDLDRLYRIQNILSET